MAPKSSRNKDGSCAASSARDSLAQSGSTSNLAIEMQRGIDTEFYLSSEKRRSESKTIAYEGGRTADFLVEWASFSDEVLQFWEEIKTPLENTPIDPNIFPVRAYHPEGKAIISDESEVRAACMTSVFGIVNKACRILGFNIQINSTSSRREAKSLVDYAGFLLDADGNALEVGLPIEIKGPWQFKLDGSKSVCEVFESVDRKTILNALSQIYYYMIVEEVQFGVLCTKEQHVFFRRSVDPEDKTLFVSKTIQYDDTNPSVRQCHLFWASKAIEGDTVNASQVPSTFPSQKWVRIPTRGHGVRGQGGSMIDGLRSGILKSLRGPSSRALGATEESTQDESSNWLFSLEDSDLESLNLGKVIKHGSRCIVREGQVFGIDVCIKMFEFFEKHDHISQFQTEIEVYKQLSDLQGVVIPKLVAYGTVWDHCVGFIAVKKEGQSLDALESPLPFNCWGKLEEAFSKIHEHKVLHNDPSDENIVLSMPFDKAYPFKIIDFGSSILHGSQEDRAWEFKYVKAYCKQQQGKGAVNDQEDANATSNRLRCFDFDVNKD